MITKNELTPFLALVKQYLYAYDDAGNRTSEQIDSSLTTSSHNDVNQLTSQAGTGPMRFSGTINEGGTVSVAGHPALVGTNAAGTNFTFSGSATVSAGTNSVPIIARDYSGNARTNNYQVIVANGVAQALDYDLNGNLVTISNATTVISNVWDAANRLVAIYSNDAYASLFAYDGFGRRVRQTETTNGVTKSDNRLVWCGSHLYEERDSTGSNVTKRYFSEGEQIGGTNYFFARDHLGSIREMTDGGGNIHARYDYDPWGRRVKIGGDLEANFGFTGYYYHSPSGSYLAVYRAYNANLGRWLSRDLIQEMGGLNLFRYVMNSPINLVDYLGLIFNGGLTLNPPVTTPEPEDPFAPFPTGPLTLAPQTPIVGVPYPNGPVELIPPTIIQVGPLTIVPGPNCTTVSGLPIGPVTYTPAPGISGGGGTLNIGGLRLLCPQLSGLGRRFYQPFHYAPAVPVSADGMEVGEPVGM